MKLAVDRSRCIGAAQCVRAAPELFDSDDSGLVQVLRAQPMQSQLEAAETARRLCPVGAIHLSSG